MGKNAGRPPIRSATKRLRVKAWFYYVASKVDLKPTGYALENYFDQDKIKSYDAGTKRRPCKFDKYQKGLHVPEPTLVDRVELSAPGSKSLIYHPFWKVIDPINDAAELFSQLNKLRPEIRGLLFYTEIQSGDVPIRLRRDFIKTLDEFVKLGDLDALTALIGLHQEGCILEKTSAPILHILYVRPLLTVIRRLMYHPPFPYIAHELFGYLSNCLFKNINSDDVDDLVSKTDISLAITRSQFLLSVVHELRTLRKFKYPPVSCLYIVERYMTEEFLELAFDLENNLNVDIRTFKRLPNTRNLIRSLRRVGIKTNKNL